MEFQHLIPLVEELMPKAELFFRPYIGSKRSFYELVMNLTPTATVAADILKAPYDAEFVDKWMLIKELGEAEMLRADEECFLDMRIEPDVSSFLDKEGQYLQSDRLLFKINLLREQGAELGVSFEYFVYFEGAWYFMGEFGQFLGVTFSELQSKLADPLAKAHATKLEYEAKAKEREATAIAEAKRHNPELIFSDSPEMFFSQLMVSELAFAKFVADSVITKAVAENIFNQDIVEMIDDEQQRELCINELAGHPDSEITYYGVIATKEDTDAQMRIPIPLYRINFKCRENSVLSEFKGFWLAYNEKWYVLLLGS